MSEKFLVMYQAPADPPKSTPPATTERQSAQLWEPKQAAALGTLRQASSSRETRPPEAIASQKPKNLGQGEVFPQCC